MAFCSKGALFLYKYSENNVWSVILREITVHSDYLIEFDGVVVPDEYADGSMDGPQYYYQLRLPSCFLADLTKREPDETDAEKRKAWSEKTAAYKAAQEIKKNIEHDALFARFQVGQKVSWTVDNSYMYMTRIDTYNDIIANLDRTTMTAGLKNKERVHLSLLTIDTE
jgi:hypothetical protein